LHAETERTGGSVASIVERALTSAFGLAHHSLSQASTTAALVQGVFQGSMRVRDLKIHGDFGLGTFEGLDGELIMLDGACYRAGPEGVIRDANGGWLTPFALITRFEADERHQLGAVDSFETLRGKLDGLHASQNVFVGIRIDGAFHHLDLRAACKAEPEEDLVAATSHQSEFSADKVEGTLVGFRAPPYTTALSVPGYHLHFVAASRTFGGHVLDLDSPELDVSLHIETDVHIAIPETKAFLEADLRMDTSHDLEITETGRPHRRNVDRTKLCSPIVKLTI
jgi:acetolactate decarboxylase